MYQLKITIDEITPPIWRLIAVPEKFSLNKLHHIIQIAFGWTNSHLYCFWQDDVPITDSLLWGGGTVRWDKKVKIWIQQAVINHACLDGYASKSCYITFCHGRCKRRFAILPYAVLLSLVRK